MTRANLPSPQPRWKSNLRPRLREKHVFSWNRVSREGETHFSQCAFSLHPKRQFYLYFLISANFPMAHMLQTLIGCNTFHAKCMFFNAFLKSKCIEMMSFCMILYILWELIFCNTLHQKWQSWCFFKRTSNMTILRYAKSWLFSGGEQLIWEHA